MPPTRGGGRWILLAALLLPSVVTGSALAGAQGLRQLVMETDGPPVIVLPADLTGDGRPDLLVATAYTYWGQASTHEMLEMEGRLVEAVEVVPVLIDKREMRLYVAGEDGGYLPAGEAQPLPFTVLAMDQGPPGDPVLALTDDGISAVRYRPGAAEPLVFEPLFAGVPAMAGSGTLLPGQRLSADLDGDGELDVLLPLRQRLAVHLSREGRLQGDAVALLEPPGKMTGKDGVVWVRYPIPEIQDVDGDGLPDLVFVHAAAGRPLVRFSQRAGMGAISIMKGVGGGRFAPAVEVHAEPRLDLVEEAVQRLVAAASTDAGSTDLLTDGQLVGEAIFFGDLDGDGRAALVVRRQIERPGKDGIRHEMEESKRPVHEYRVHPLGPGMSVAAEPSSRFQAQGHPFDFDWLRPAKGGFQDLDGDGMQELITVDLDFSLWQIPKILLARTIGVGLDFHVWAAADDGVFHEVEAGRMRGKLKVSLGKLRVSEIAQFAGDFDADGRIDFVRLGGGRKVEIHRGAAGSVYSARPDITLSLRQAPNDVGLVRVRDLDGDGRDDLLVVTPLETDEDAARRPSRLEIYLTGPGAA